MDEFDNIIKPKVSKYVIALRSIQCLTAAMVIFGTIDLGLKESIFSSDPKSHGGNFIFNLFTLNLIDDYQNWHTQILVSLVFSTLTVIWNVINIWIHAWLVDLIMALGLIISPSLVIQQSLSIFSNSTQIFEQSPDNPEQVDALSSKSLSNLTFLKLDIASWIFVGLFTGILSLIIIFATFITTKRSKEDPFGMKKLRSLQWNTV